MFIGAFMYTNSRILGSYSMESLKIDKMNEIKDTLNNSLSLLDHEIFENRFESFHSKLYLAAAILMVLVYLFHTIVVELIGNLLYTIFCCPCLRKETAKI